MKTACFVVAAACLAQFARAGDDELHAKVENGFVRITAGERPVLLYRYEGAPKPYVKELYTPGGVQVLLDSPPDHVHHHGLMFALGVNDVNFWEESENAGKQVSRTIVTTDAQSSTGFVEEIAWCSHPGDTLLLEYREIRACSQKPFVEAGARLVDWQSRLLVPNNIAQVQLTGSHYFGLGMRFVRSMDKDGTFLISDKAEGETVRGDEKLYPGRWCAYTAGVDGKPVTVAMFSPPNNPRPTTWFTMKDPFAYLSATLKLHQEPMTLHGGEQLRLDYAIVAWDGKIERAQIEKVYQLWLDLYPAAATQPRETATGK